MATGKFISYLRVSTERQGRSGLGMEAQRKAVADFLNGGAWTVLREFVEVESGKRDDRPELSAAMAECRLTGATLVIAKLDRLSRDAAFLLSLQKAGVEFVAADMPNATRFTVHIYAALAEQERKMISDRTKAALAVAKAAGKVLGGYRNGPKIQSAVGVLARQEKAASYAAAVRPVLREMRDRGLSLRQIVVEVEQRGVCTPAGGAWTAGLVSRLLAS